MKVYRLIFCFFISLGVNAKISSQTVPKPFDYFQKGDYRASINEFNKTINETVKVWGASDTFFVLQSYLLMGACYQELNKIDSAIIYQEKTNEIYLNHVKATNDDYNFNMEEYIANLLRSKEYVKALTTIDRFCTIKDLTKIDKETRISLSNFLNQIKKESEYGIFNKRIDDLIYLMNKQNDINFKHLNLDQENNTLNFKNDFQYSFDKKMQQALNYLNAKNLDKLIVVTDEINQEYNKDTLKYYNQKISVFFLNSLVHVMKNEYYKSNEYLIKLIPICSGPDLINTYSSLVSNYISLRDINNALLYCKNLADKQKEINGEDDTGYIESLNLIESFYYDLGNYEKSLETNINLKEKIKKVYGDDHESFFVVLDRIGNNYIQMGQYDKALEINIEISEKRKSLLGEDHPDFLTSLNNLAHVYSLVGNINKAVEINLKISQKRKIIYGDTHELYLISLNNLATNYSDLGETHKALEINLEVVRKRKIVLGEEHQDYLTSLNNLAINYLDLGLYKECIEINQDVSNRTKMLYGDDHPGHLLSLANLAVAYSKSGQLNNSLEINLLVCEKRKSTLGEDHPDYLTSLNNLSFVYTDLGQYDKAMTINLEVSEKRRKVLGENHPYFINSLNNLSTNYADLGQFKKSIEINSEVLKKIEKLYGQNHPDYLLGMSNLAQTYSKNGQINDALEINLFVCEKRKVLLGENHLDYLTSLNNVAVNYSELGQFDKALEINLNLAQKEKVILGENHASYLTTLNNLSQLYADMGQFDKSLAINLDVAEKRKKILGENHPEYLTSLNNLSTNYITLLQYDRALNLLLEVTEKRRQLLGVKHPEYLISLNNTARLLSKLGFHNEALGIDLDIFMKSKEILGENHPVFLKTLSNIAMDFYELGNYEKALEGNIRAVYEKKRVLGENHPDYLLSMNNLAVTYFKLGQIVNSRESNISVLKKLENLFGRSHPMYSNTLRNLAYCYETEEQIEKSMKYLIQVNELDNQSFNSNFKLLTEKEKENYILNKYEKDYNFNSFTYRHHESITALSNENFNISLNSKNQILKSSQFIRKSLAFSDDVATISQYDRWMTLKRQIAKQSLIPKGERSQNIDTVQIQVNELERDLVRYTKYWSEDDRNLTCTEIYQKLNQNDVVVEFIEFGYHNMRNWTDSILYAAIILTKEDTLSKFVPLFEEKQLLSLVNSNQEKESDNINHLYKNSQLFNLIWQPISKYIPKGSNILYSPSGILHQINLASLMNSDSTYLSDKYNFSNLSSISKIANLKIKSELKSISVFGGMDYEAKDLEISKSIANINKDVDYVSRGLYIQDSTRSGKWSYLSGTKKEAENIYNISKGANISAKLYMGNDAIEEQYKNLDGDKSPSILHIATHGFFFPDPKISKEKLDRLAFHTDNPFTLADNPMNRSGLLFSGSNKAWVGDSISLDREDGILTAYEASHSYLKNTELVVLSACETGLGDIKGSEGVYGLQRAFKMAGARYLMMSLWKVPDNATQEFMTTFYTELLTHKKSIRDAYNATQKQMRDKYRDEPYKWAGFVLME